MLNVDSNALLLNTILYGKWQNKEVFTITLQNEGIRVELTNLGCTLTAICTPDKNGTVNNIVAGFADLESYKNNREYFGCIIGRYANRIAGGRFVLDGKEIRLSVNDGPNHLHGGFEGFHKKIWNIGQYIRTKDRVGIVFHYESKHGEEGYPGNLHVTVKYTLNSKRQLIIEYCAETDRPTPVNLTNHSYFNLTGFQMPSINDHILQIPAWQYTEKNEHNLPTGKILPLAGTPLDFETPVDIGSNIAQFPLDHGFDHNYILTPHAAGELVLAATLRECATGRTLTVFTSQPAMQVYTANSWDGTICGQQGYYYQQHGAVALETQFYPDSPNHPLFPNTILMPGEQYSSTTIYEFGVDRVVAEL